MVKIKINVFDNNNKYITSIVRHGKPGDPVGSIFGPEVLVLSPNLPEVFPDANTLYKVKLLTRGANRHELIKLLVGGALILTSTTLLIARHLHNK